MTVAGGSTLQRAWGKVCRERQYLLFSYYRVEKVALLHAVQGRHWLHCTKRLFLLCLLDAFYYFMWIIGAVLARICLVTLPVTLGLSCSRVWIPWDVGSSPASVSSCHKSNCEFFCYV